jgi:hypothetical protein
MFTACLPQHSQNPTRTNRSSGLIKNSYLLDKQLIIDNSCLGLANTQDERFTPFLVIKIKWNDLTFGLGIIILQGVSRRKSLAGVNIMHIAINHGNVTMNLPKHSQIPISHHAMNHNTRHQLIIDISTAQKHVKTKKSLSNLNETFSQKITNFSSLKFNPYQSKIQMRLSPQNSEWPAIYDINVPT